MDSSRCSRRFAARAFLRKARGGDRAVVGREALEPDGEVEDFFACVPGFFGKRFQLAWLDGVAPSTGVWAGPLGLSV